MARKGKGADRKIEVLGNTDLFRHVKPDGLARLAEFSDQLHFPKGKVLASEGGLGRELIVIVDGEVSVTRDGTEVATLGPGDAVGEIALLDGGPRTATVTATTDIEALVIEGRALRGLLQDVDGFAENLLKSLAARLRAADEKLAG